MARKTFWKAQNIHRDLPGLSPGTVYSLLREMANQPIPVGTSGQATFTMEPVKYGKTATTGTIVRPVPEWDGIYQDKLSIGIANVDGQLMLRVGPARKCLRPFQHISETMPEDWRDVVTFQDKRYYKLRKKALESVADVLASKLLQGGRRSA